MKIDFSPTAGTTHAILDPLSFNAKIIGFQLNSFRSFYFQSLFYVHLLLFRVVSGQFYSWRRQTGSEADKAASQKLDRSVLWYCFITQYHMNIRCSILLLSLNICGKFWQKWILESNKKRDFFMLRNNSKFILFRIVETTANCKYFRGHCSGRTTVFICLCRGTWSEETESWLKLERKLDQAMNIAEFLQHKLHQLFCY